LVASLGYPFSFESESAALAETSASTSVPVSASFVRAIAALAEMSALTIDSARLSFE